ncbi:sensor domain-containing protein [Streptomyces sp. NPDC049837]|uniref:sensor domain-containing protein n=1 Tax=Streptomyces sp. NPDC049837 TaxID=3155277 RepID=UPI0034444523
MTTPAHPFGTPPGTTPGVTPTTPPDATPGTPPGTPPGTSSGTAPGTAREAAADPSWTRQSASSGTPSGAGPGIPPGTRSGAEPDATSAPGLRTPTRTAPGSPSRGLAPRRARATRARRRPSVVAAVRASMLPARRLTRQRNPLRMLLSAAPWRATGYLAGYVVAGTVFFAVATAAVLVGIVFSQLTVTVALTIGSVWVVRCCAQVERGRAVLVDAPVPYAYQEVTEPGLVGHLKARCTDPAFYRDCCYLILLHPFLLLLDALTLAVWLPLLTGVSLPLWFWAVESRQADGGFADGVRLGRSDGTGAGIWIDTWPAALAASAVFLVLAMYASYAVVAAARLHLTVAHTLLRPPPDPLAEAKHVLAAPGPLSLTPSRPVPGPTAHGGHRT